MSDTGRDYAFQHPGLDRAEHFRDDASALDARWSDGFVLLIDAEGQAHFFGELESPTFLQGRDVSTQRHAHASFLGIGDGNDAWFALHADHVSDLPLLSLDLRSAAKQWPVFSASVFAQARALLHWQQRNLYCGACGQVLRTIRGGFCAHCSQCGLEHYPRTDPAIIVAVSDGERILLGRQASWPEGRWSVLAGFLEPGESLEQAVAREVMEEAGVTVASCTYVGSQPWPFPASLMLGFHATAKPQAVRIGAELQDARWFSADELRASVASGELQLSPKLSISRWLLDDWLSSR